MEKQARFPYQFFVVTFAWSWLVWLPLVLTSVGILPIGKDLLSALTVPAIIVGAFGPAAGTFYCLKTYHGKGAIRQYLRGLLDFRLGWRAWLLPILVLGGSTWIAWMLPELWGEPRVDMLLPSLWAFPPYVLFTILLGGGQEELGWRGYILDPMEARLGAWLGNLVLGVIWACWHLPLYFIQGSSQTFMPFAGFVLQTIGYSWFHAYVRQASGKRTWAGLISHGWANAFVPLFPTVVMVAGAAQPRYWIWVSLTFVIGLITMALSGTRLQRRIRRKAGHIMLILFSILLACLLILVGVLQLWSPGKLTPFVDENGKPLVGSVSEKVFVNINGVEQGMFVTSTDARHPVLLYLHGGIPDYFLTQRYPTGLEDYFTVVWWEQRGSGLSYSSDIPPETMTLEQMISDTLELTNYLRHRFGKEKIYLMGHSGGTFIGIQVAARAPELYHAYIGVAQMSNQLKSERLAYKYMLEQFQENGNLEMVRKLEAAPVTMTGGIPDAYLALRDEAMHSLGIGTAHDMNSILSGIFFPSLTFRGYTLLEKINLWRGKSQTGVSSMWGQIIATDLTIAVPELEIPVYFFGGIYDYTVSYTEAKSYFEKLKAPVKGFYTFEQSAHSPIFEEPEKTLKILQKDVLAGTNSLADAK